MKFFFFLVFCGIASVVSPSIVGSSTAFLDSHFFEENIENFGISVAKIGDVNGDGFPDLAVGGNMKDINVAIGGGDAPPGSVYIFFCGENGLPLVDSEGQYQFTEVVLDLPAGVNFGHSIAGLGDIDGDGKQEIAVGAPATKAPTQVRGEVYIVSLNQDGSVHDSEPIRTQVSSADVNNAYFGSSVANVGDIDGDGVTDIAVGAERVDGRGAVFIVKLDTNKSVKGFTSIVSDVSDPSGIPVVANDEFGSSVALIGDVDGDGISDLAVGAPGGGDSYQTNSGEVWIIFLNQDATVKGFTKIGGSSAFALTSGANLGLSVGASGDLNGDGVADLVAGAPGNSGSGAIFVLYLTSSGAISSFASIDSLDDIPDSPAIGRSVFPLGDVDGDGHLDLWVSGAQWFAKVHTTRGCLGSLFAEETSPGTCSCSPGLSGQRCDKCNIIPLTSGVGDGNTTISNVGVKMDAEFDRDTLTFSFSITVDYHPHTSIRLGVGNFDRDTRSFGENSKTNGPEVFFSDEHALINNNVGDKKVVGDWEVTYIACNKIVYTTQIHLYQLQTWGSFEERNLEDETAQGFQRISQRWIFRTIVLYDDPHDEERPITVMSESFMAVIRILTITVTADVDSRFQNLGFASPPFNMGDKDGFLGWSYETTMYTVPLQTATFLSGPQQSEITLASADPNNNRKQVWDILLTENCIDCSGSYVFRHQSQQIDDFTVTNIVFYRYEQPVVGEGDLFTSLYLYRDDFDISGDQKFLVGDTIGVLARIIDLESAGVSGVSYRTATLCAKNNPTQTCADVSSADRVTLINNFLPITTGTAQKFEVSGAASPSGSETTSAAFTFKAHSLNGKRSLTLEVVVNINVGRRMREMNLRLNIPDRVLASQKDAAAETNMEIDDPSGIEGINVKSAGASVQFSLSLVFALLLALHHA